MLNIVTTENDTQNVLGLFGRLDTSTAADLQKTLMAQLELGKDVILDFKDLVYVSSAGLRVLLMGEKTAKSKDVSMKLKNVSEDIMEVFNMTGFASVLKFEEVAQ
ncbi:MAG: STAS domain-containing protein [Oscillospiraceae bacterium]|nr:STAS domain-containing protein [Oscillospiraceae bacterium]